MILLRISITILSVIILLPTISFSQLTLGYLKDKGFNVKGNYKIMPVTENIAIEDYDNDGFQDFAKYEGKELTIYKCIGNEYVISFEKEFTDTIEKINWVRNSLHNTHPYLVVHLKNKDTIILNKNLISKKDGREQSIFYSSDNFQQVWEYTGTLETSGFTAVGDVNNNDTLDATYFERVDYGGSVWRLKIFESSGDNQYKSIYSLTDSIGDAGGQLTDFDKNGKKEIILLHNSGWLHFLEYDGAGNYILYNSDVSYSYEPRYLKQVLETDIDRDGTKEIVLMFTASGIVVGPNTYIGIAKFQGKNTGPEFWNYIFYRWTYWLEYDCYAAGIAVGDIDGDGTNEIVIGTQCSVDSIPYFDYDEVTRTFTLKHIPNEYPNFGAITHPMIFDFDRDGKKEIVATGAGFYVIKSTGIDQFQTVFFDSVDKHFNGNTGIATVQLSINHGLINGSEVTAVGSDYAVIVNGRIVEEYSRVYSFKNLGVNNYQRYWTSEFIDTGRIFSINIADMDKDRKESFIFPLQLSRGKLLDYEKTTVSSIENHDTGNDIQNFELSQNYPNPFNQITKIRYYLPKGGDVKLEIYSIHGQLIKTLVNEKQKGGVYEIKWNGRNESEKEVSSGIYFCKFTNNGLMKKIRKIVLLK